MSKEISMADVIDAGDMSMHDGEQLVRFSGVIKMAAAGAYFHPVEPGKEKCERLLSLALSAARKKGWGKADMLRTAFSGSFPPSRVARSLADDLAAQFSTEEVMALMAELGS